ncbi:unnamed protein product [Owenia fusiformis]|uniref:SUEL-type lectin domain-containing protein n=1 Tax=Owenia fusiformis TaxID=6347 RepID=A0A8S4PJ92_OWEFU|nr:unnamed protein product [Owenia fusiformis]
MLIMDGGLLNNILQVYIILIVYKLCITSGQHLFEKYHSEGEYIKASCPFGEVIYFETVSYPSTNNYISWYCDYPIQQAEWRPEIKGCNGRRVCNIKSIHEKCNPCPAEFGCTQYEYISYGCMSNERYEQCKGRNIALNCYRDSINVLSVTHGWRYNCIKQRSMYCKKNETIEYAQWERLNELEEMCNGRSNCNVYSSPTGNCYANQRYVQNNFERILYNCIPKRTTIVTSTELSKRVTLATITALPLTATTTQLTSSAKPSRKPTDPPDTTGTLSTVTISTRNSITTNKITTNTLNSTIASTALGVSHVAIILSSILGLLGIVLVVVLLVWIIKRKRSRVQRTALAKSPENVAFMYANANERVNNTNAIVQNKRVDEPDLIPNDTHDIEHEQSPGNITDIYAHIHKPITSQWDNPTAKNDDHQLEKRLPDNHIQHEDDNQFNDTPKMDENIYYATLGDDVGAPYQHKHSPLPPIPAKMDNYDYAAGNDDDQSKTDEAITDDYNTIHFGTRKPKTGKENNETYGHLDRDKPYVRDNSNNNIEINDVKDVQHLYTRVDKKKDRTDKSDWNQGTRKDPQFAVADDVSDMYAHVNKIKQLPLTDKEKQSRVRNEINDMYAKVQKKEKQNSENI